MSDFGQELKKALRAKGITQKQLARNINSEERAIKLYCAGKRTPTQKTVEKIERSLGLSKGTLARSLAEQKNDNDYFELRMSKREKAILGAWRRGEKTPEEVSAETGYPMEIVRMYLPTESEEENL